MRWSSPLPCGCCCSKYLKWLPLSQQLRLSHLLAISFAVVTTIKLQSYPCPTSRSTLSPRRFYSQFSCPLFCGVPLPPGLCRLEPVLITVPSSSTLSFLPLLILSTPSRPLCLHNQIFASYNRFTPLAGIHFVVSSLQSTTLLIRILLQNHEIRCFRHRGVLLPWRRCCCCSRSPAPPQAVQSPPSR